MVQGATVGRRMGVERTMPSLSYCRSCFERLLAAASTADQLRLKKLIGSWRPVGSVGFTHGFCERCGREGEVLQYEIIP